MNNLELATTKELVDELLTRSTFQGIVIHATDAYKGGEWGNEKDFLIHMNDNLSNEERVRVLETFADHLKERA